MTVRNDNAAQHVRVLEYVGVIGQNKVDTRLIVVWKHKTAVGKDKIVTILERRHIFADAIKASERNNF